MSEGPQVSRSSLSSHCRGPSFRLGSWRPQTDSVAPPPIELSPARTSTLGHGPVHPPPLTDSGQEAPYSTGASRTHPTASPPPAAEPRASP